MAHLNRLDSNDSFNNGNNAEKRFEKLFRGYGFDVRKTGIRDEAIKHLDFYITKSHKTYRVEVKSRKRISRWGKLQDDYTWVELKHRTGRKGWLYISQCDYFAFEVSDGFLMVRKDVLQRLILDRVTSDIVTNPSHAVYRQYIQREQPLTRLTLVPTKTLALTAEIYIKEQV